MLLVYLEHSKGALPKGTLLAIDAALKAKAAHGYSSVVALFVGGESVETAANSAAKYGLDEVNYIEGANLDPILASVHAPLVIQVAKDKGAKCVLSLADTTGKDIMPRVAQALEAGQSSETLAFLDGGQFRRPMYAGNVIADVEITTDVKVVTVRGTAFDKAVESGAAGAVSKLDLSAPEGGGQEFISFDTVESSRPELTEAEVVVSGGRAMKSEENFKEYIEPLADVLGAAIGASRAAVDSGYAPNDWQVGQTGKVVAPSLYIAIGISGAIQHLAGMKDSKVIVAINKDEEAPIFQVADFGLVADLFTAVPELIEKL